MIKEKEVTSKPTKLTEEENKKLKDSETQLNNIIWALGRHEAEKILFEKEKETLDNAYLNIHEENKKLAKELTEKYGEGSLDLDTGTFIPVQKETEEKS